MCFLLATMTINRISGANRNDTPLTETANQHCILATLPVRKDWDIFRHNLNVAKIRKKLAKLRKIL